MAQSHQHGHRRSPFGTQVLYNGMLMRGGTGDPVRVEPWRDKAEMVQTPTVYEVAHRNGLTTAEVDGVAIQNPGTINWSSRSVRR